MRGEGRGARRKRIVLTQDVLERRELAGGGVVWSATQARLVDFAILNPPRASLAESSPRTMDGLEKDNSGKIIEGQKLC